MKNDMDELDQFISYLQFERYYSKKTISSYATDLHEAKKFWQENGGFAG
jgi:integrase/recombinase XerC